MRSWSFVQEKCGQKVDNRETWSVAGSDAVAVHEGFAGWKVALDNVYITASVSAPDWYDGLSD